MACSFFGGPAAFLFRLMLSPLLLIMYHEDIKREPGKNIVNYKNCIIERFSMLSLRYRGAFLLYFMAARNLGNFTVASLLRQ